MASVMAIGSTKDDATSYNFLGNNVLKPVIGTIQIQDNLDGTATTSFTLRSLSGVTDAQIRAQIDALSDIAETIDLYWSDPLVVDDIWLKMYADGETACWSLIHKMVIQPAPMSLYTPLMGYNYAQYTVAITHDNWREDAVATNAAAVQTLSGTGGKYWISTGTVVGGLPSRISSLSLRVNSTSTGIYRCWIGIKPTYKGDTTPNDISKDINTFWNLADGTLGTDATTRQATSAYPGSQTNCVRVSFATTGVMTERIAMTPVQTTSVSPLAHNQWIGKYLVLLRCSLDAAGEVGLKLKAGYEDGTEYVEKEIKYFDHTAWRYVELGEIYIPPFSRPGTYQYLSADISKAELQIEAERTTGNCNLDMNGLVLIPSNHMAYIEAINFFSTIGVLYLNDKPDGTKDVWNLGLNGYRKNVLMSWLRQWEIPADKGCLVFAGEDQYVQNTATQATITLYNYNRNRIHSV